MIRLSPPTIETPATVRCERRHYDRDSVKQAAASRWVEILHRIGSIPFEYLDGSHHGCPICGQGKDCFRLIDEEAGAILCNKCFSSNNGDGFAALMKATGRSFPEVLADVAAFVGIQPSAKGSPTRKDRTKKEAKDPFAKVKWVEEPALSNCSYMVNIWCEKKPPITPSAVADFGGRLCDLPMDGGALCLGFTGTDLDGNKKALLLYRSLGWAFPAVGTLPERKTHLAGGSVESWLMPIGQPLADAQVVHKCEGLPDALTLHSLGLPEGQVAITNACGAKSANPKKLDYSWAKGKGVVIAADADIPGVEGGKLHAVQAYKAGAAWVKLVVPPGYEILDDHGRDFRDWFVEGHTMAEYQAHIDSTEPFTAEQIEELAPTRERRKSEESDESESPNAAAVASVICAEDRFAKDAGGKLYRFVDGVYHRKAEDYIRAQVKRICIALGSEAKWSKRLAEETLEFISVDAPELWERPPLDVLNVKNGLLRISDRELMPHSPGHLSSVQLQVDYDPGAGCPAIEKFVQEVFPEDAADLAWEIPGWLMVPDVSIQKAILLTGEGANGKSTYLTLVTAFIGKVNTSNVALQWLEKDKFKASRLIGKLANICSDLPSEHLAGTSVFKAITGGDSVDGEYKFKDSFDFVPFARFVFSANHPPRSPDASHAFFRRWVVIPFDRTLDPAEQIPRDVLDARLADPKELSGLLNKALDARDRLHRQHGFSEPASCKGAWNEFYATTDPLAVWLEKFTVDHRDAVVPRDQLRIAYNADCERRGRPIMNRTQFGRAVNRCRPGLEDRQRTVNGKLTWCYVGIGLSNLDDSDSLGSRSSRSSPGLFLSHARESEEEQEGDQDQEAITREQNKENSVNPVKDCRHVWTDEKDPDGRVRVVCSDCGKFQGYRR